MLAKDIDVYVRSIKQKLGVRKYMPAKYFSGLKTRAAIRARVNDILTGVYTTDAIPVPRKTSVYTKKYDTELKTGIPKSIMDAVYARGLAAWKSGHRVGATPQQWGHARQKSFAVRGCTWYSADHDLAVRAMKTMSPKDVRAWTRRDSCAKHAHDCCSADSHKKWCTNKTTDKVFKLPRKFSKAACTRGSIRGFTMRASCAPYKGCG